MTPDHHPGQEPWHHVPDDFIERLALGSRLNESVRQKTLEYAARALAAPPSVIIDIGSGIGADAVALAQRFPTARIHALDISAELLERVTSMAAASGLEGRIVGHQADLNDDWPKEIPQGADLAWASLSMHHLNDPAGALRRVFTALKPGGILALTELSNHGVFTPSDLGTGHASLQERMTREQSRHGPQETPDWSKLLEQAGFTAVAHHAKEFTARTDTPDGVRYLEMQLHALREQFAADVSAEEGADIDTVIDAVTAGESAISFTTGLGVWIAVRPQNTFSALPEPRDEKERPVSRPGGFEADVAVIGGGAAGLAAAIALARSRRRVVVINAGDPRNAPAAGAHNVLGHEGISPFELLARGQAEAESYGVQIVPGHATGVTGRIDDFLVEIDGGTHRVRARRIILATGLVDDLPDVPGIEERWGRTVLHCPFCHGWEVRDKHLAILARDELAIHQVMLFGALSDRLTVFLHDAPDPTEEQWEQLAALGAEIVRPRVERLVMDGAAVRGVEIEDGRILEVDAVVVTPRFNARTELYESLGGEAESTPFGRQIPATPTGMTDVPGVWAAGNASQFMAMVSAAAASGMTTGAAVHGELTFAELDEATEAHRARAR